MIRNVRKSVDFVIYLLKLAENKGDEEDDFAVLQAENERNQTKSRIKYPHIIEFYLLFPFFSFIFQFFLRTIYN
jgi:hypothetical protein